MSAARPTRDTEDVVILARAAGKTTPDEILDTTRRYYPEPPTEDEATRQRLIAEAAADELSADGAV